MAFTFFRKYNKLILAVGGSLLMVVFLIPQAGSWLGGSPTGQGIGRIGSKTLTVGDRRRANAEMRLVQILFSDARWMRTTLPLGEDSELRWLLGIEEARQMGLWVSGGEVDQLFAQEQVTSDRVAQVKTEMNVSDAFVEQAVRHAMLWRRLRRLVEQPARVSEPRLRHFHQQLGSTAAVDTVKIPSDHLVDSVEAPTEQELRDRFRINRDDAPGRGPYGLGYRLPPRVKLEYIAVPLAPIREEVTVDEVEARVYYKDNRERFIAEPEEQEQPEGDGAAADEGGEAGGPAEPQPYEAVRERIVETLKDQKARRQQQRAVNLIVAELSEAMRGIQREPTTGYYELPPNWQPPDLEKVAVRVQEAEGIDVLPRVRRIEDRWLTMEDIGVLPGLGQATVEMSGARGQREVPVTMYIAATRELGLTQVQQQLRQLAIQEDVASRPVSGPEGTKYVFRVSEAQPSQPPASLDLVRERVVEDVKRLKAYRMLKERAESYVARAAEEGLAELAERLGEDFAVESMGPFPQREIDQQQLQFFGRLSVRPPRLPGIGQSARFVDQVFEMVRPLGVVGNLAAVPASQRTGSIALDDQLALYIVAVTEFTPAYAEDYKDRRGQLAFILRSMDVDQVNAVTANPFSLEALAARVGFVREEPEEDETLPEGEQPMDAPQRERTEAKPAEEAAP